MGNVDNYIFKFEKDNVPEEMREKNQWVCWNRDKVPINPINNKFASSSNPLTWSSITTTLKNREKNNWPGIGYMFYNDYVGIDLDDCFKGNDLTDDAKKVIDLFPTYTEISPSGKGLHLLTKGTVPGNYKRSSGIEVYDKGRYFTITSNLYNGIKNISNGDLSLKILFPEIDTVPKEEKIDITRDREWQVEHWLLNEEEGQFKVSDVMDYLGAYKDEKMRISRILHKMIDKGLIEKTGKVGYYNIIKQEVKVMNFKEIEENPIDIILPFGINKIVNIMEKNIIVVAGAPNSGKTAFLLNIVKDNMHQYNVRYYNSEMGGIELRSRLDLFEGLDVNDWDFQAFEVNTDFHHVIDKIMDQDKKSRNNLHIIDYLEVYDQHYIIGKLIDQIYRKMSSNDIAIIAIQKRPGDDYGRGGITTIEKARLALSMDNNTVRVIKAKNWKTKVNPYRMEVEFKLVNGSRFIMDNGDFGDKIYQ